MHTILKRTDEPRFDVGMWLINREGYHQFSRVAWVGSQAEALQLVNFLNGGEGFAADVPEGVHLYD